MFKVFGFYKFIEIKSLKKNKSLLQKFLTLNNIRGTIIIAKEGLNGTISGHIKDIDKTIKKLKFLFTFKYFDNNNESKSKFQPFHKPKVKIKKEIVPFNPSLVMIIVPLILFDVRNFCRRALFFFKDLILINL